MDGKTFTATKLIRSNTEEKKLFRSFVRLDSPLRTTVPGTGLGLYLTKKMVTEILKGEIMVESDYGKGSRFTMRIPTEAAS